MVDLYQYDIFYSRWGWVGILVSQRGLYATTLPMETWEQCLDTLGRKIDVSGWFFQAYPEIRMQISNCLYGIPRSHNLMLDLSDIPFFSRQALTTCGKIPFGETRSYSWIAQEIGFPRSARGVGRVMANNRIPLIIPCHRVIGKNGQLGGYRDGTWWKSRLLDAEKLHSSSSL